MYKASLHSRVQCDQVDWLRKWRIILSFAVQNTRTEVIAIGCWCTTSTKESRHRSSTPRRTMYSMILTEPSRPAVRHSQSDPCHSIAPMKTFEAKLLKGAACSLLFLHFYIFHSPCLTLTEVDIATCDDVLTIDVCKDLQVSTDILRGSSATVPPVPVWLDSVPMALDSDVEDASPTTASKEFEADICFLLLSGLYGAVVWSTMV